MRQVPFSGWMAFVLLAMLPGTSRAVDPTAIAEELKAVVEANFKAITDKDLDAAMKSVHTESPNYPPTKAATENLFKSLNIKATLESFEFVGLNEPYAIARVRQKSVKVDGPAFRDNVLDSYWIFRQEGGAWKLWTSATLELKFLPAQN